MPITINATAKDANANSWATLAEATAFFATDFDSAPWADAADDELRKRALVSAFNRLEQERYRGTRTTTTQRASMPRTGLVRDGDDVDADTIHESCKRAQFILAREILRSNLLKPDAMKNFQSLNKTGGSFTPRFKLDGQLPDDVVRELSWCRLSSNRLMRA